MDRLPSLSTACSGSLAQAQSAMARKALLPDWASGTRARRRRIARDTSEPARVMPTAAPGPSPHMEGKAPTKAPEPVAIRAPAAPNGSFASRREAPLLGQVMALQRAAGNPAGARLGSAVQTDAVR